MAITRKSFNTILEDLVKQLSLLRLEASTTHFITDHYLKSIFNILFREYQALDINLQLELPDLMKLAELCIKVLECKRTSNLEVWSRCELSALRILILVARKPLLRSDESCLRDLFYNSLIKNLDISQLQHDPTQLDRVMTKAGLSAYCLAQINIERILSTKVARALIAQSVLPLAVRCLREESVHRECTLQDFLEDFHGLNGYHDEVFVKDSFYKYPLVMRLLIALRRSFGPQNDTGSLNSVIAGRGGKISAEDVVAFNVHQALCPRDYIKNEKFMNATMTTRGFHKAHMAFLMWHSHTEFLNRASMKQTFAKHMLDNLVTGNEFLLDEIAVRYILEEGKNIGNLNELLAGREAEILSKLGDTDASLEIYNMFLRYIKRLYEHHVVQFESLIFRPISQAIQNLNKSKFGNSRSCDTRAQLEISLSCLRHLMRLRKHRLEADQEVELNHALLLLAKTECLDCSHLSDGILLTVANSRQVQPDAWQLMLILIRNALPLLDKCPDDFSAASINCYVSLGEKNLAAIINTINMTLPHFLITDTNYFYNEIASLEVLELIYKYCEHSICSLKVLQLDTVEIVLKAILITRPEGSEKTKLDSSQYRLMLKKFIKLLVLCLLDAGKNIPTTARKYPDLREEDKVAELLFGLVAAYTKHRDALDCVLSELAIKSIVDDADFRLTDSIKRWINLIVNDGRQLSPGPFHYYGSQFRTDWDPPARLDRFSNAVIAYEGYKALNGVPKFRELSRLMIETINSALLRGKARAPVDSTESQMYQTMMAGLVPD